MSERGNAKLNGAGLFECTVCGATQAPPRLPVALDGFLGALRSFIDRHAACVPVLRARDLPPMPVLLPAFRPGQKVLFDLRNREVVGKVSKLSEPDGKNVLIKYHGGNFVWRKAAYVRPMESEVLA